MKYYSTTAISQAFERAEKLGYQIMQIEEGTLGHGHVICIPPEGYYWLEIREVYLNEWTSGHTVRRTAKASKRMLKEIDEAWEQIWREDCESLWEQGWTWDMY